MSMLVQAKPSAASYIIARLPSTGPPSPTTERRKSPELRTYVVSRNARRSMSTMTEYQAESPFVP